MLHTTPHHTRNLRPHSFNQKSKLKNQKLPLALLLSLAISSTSLAATPNSFLGPDQGLWSNANNWSASLIPNNNSSQTFDVFINQPTPITVQLDQFATINTLTIASPDTLSIQSPITLAIAAGSISNTGSILLNGTNSALSISSDTALSGQGTILLNSPSNKITGTSGVRLTNDNLISGQGSLGLGLLKFTNSGTISATTGTLTIAPQNATDGFINTGILRADGGTLLLAAANYVNTGGVIEVLNGSSISMAGTITGGTIRGSGSITRSTSNVPTFQNVDIDGAITYVSNFSTSLILLGTINNHGTLTLAAGSSQLGSNNTINSTLNNTGTISLGAAAFSVGASSSLLGAGTFLMTSPQSFLTGSLLDRFFSDNTISGQGTIDINSFKFTNSGTIIASAGVLTFTPSSAIGNFVNTATIRADGGTLVFSNPVACTNTGGIIEAINGSLANIAGNIIDGTLRGLGGTVTLMNNSTLQNVALAGNIVTKGAIALTGTVTNTGILSPASPSTLAGPSSVFQNSGSIVLGATSLSMSGSLTGAGSVLLNSPSSNFTAVNTDNGISGQGSLTLSGHNSGIIAATAGLLKLVISTISPNSFLNDGTLLANGGTLDVYSGTITNTGGTIQAETGSSILVGGGPADIGSYPNTLVVGGTIQAENGATITLRGAGYGNLLRIVGPQGSIRIDNAQNHVSPDNALTISNLDNTGLLYIENGAWVHFSGTVTNAGLIQLSSLFNGIIFTGIAIAAPATTISGGGTIQLGAARDILFGLNSSAGSSSWLTTDNLITGTGTVGDSYFRLTSNNLVVAPAGAVLLIKSIVGPNAVTNNGILRADGGTLSVNGGICNNASGTIEALNDGVLNINVDILGGTLRATNGGVLIFATGSHTASVSTLFLSTGTANTYTSTVDLRTSKLILQSTDPTDKFTKIAGLNAAISSGSTGNWTGTGLTSSTAAQDPAHYAVGVFDNALLQLTSFGGQPTDTNSILTSIAHLGDANDNGIVDIQDLTLIANHWQNNSSNTPTFLSTWTHGDLNRDGVVDIQDFTLVANNWQQTSSFPLNPSGLTSQDSGPTNVPEPASLSLLLALIPLFPRHRRNRTARYSS